MAVEMPKRRRRHRTLNEIILAHFIEWMVESWGCPNCVTDWSEMEQEAIYTRLRALAKDGLVGHS